jgi:integrase
MSVYYNRARGHWMYDFERGGERHAGYCVDLETDDPARNKTEAKRIEEKLKVRAGAAAKAARDRQSASDATGVTVAMILQEYLSRASQRNRSASLNATYAREIAGYFGAGRLLSDITERDIDEFRRWLMAQPVKSYLGGPRRKQDIEPDQRFRASGRTRAPATVNHYLLALQSAWTKAHARHAHRLHRFPACPPIELLPAPEHIPNPVRNEDVARLIAVAPHHLLVTIALATHTSMRLEEILGLEWSEVNFDFGIIRLEPRTKGFKGRVIHLTEMALGLLRFLHDTRPEGQIRVVLYWPSGFGNGTPRPISSIRTAWVTALKATGLEQTYRFHDLRGAMGTYLAAQGVNTMTLQKWLGHADIKTTQRYVALADLGQRTASRIAEGYAGTDGVLEQVQRKPILSTKDEARRFVGVYAAAKTRYEAKITIKVNENGKSTRRVLYLGSYGSAEDAARAYDAEALKHPGRRLNFPGAELANRPDSQTESPKRARDRKQASG